MALVPSVGEYSAQFHGTCSLGAWPSSGSLRLKSDFDIWLCTGPPLVSIGRASWIHCRRFLQAHISSLGPSGVDSTPSERYLHAILAIHFLIRALCWNMHLRAARAKCPNVFIGEDNLPTRFVDDSVCFGRTDGFSATQVKSLIYSSISG